MLRTFIPGLSFASSADRRQRTFFQNDLEVFNAEIWAREALLQLTGNLVLGNIVYRDFSDQVAKFGDTVNVARPGTFNAQRKGALCEDIKIQDASADSFSVPLDQFLYTSFKICDGEENRAMVDLVNTFLTPAADSLIRKIDLILGGQHVNYWHNFAGHLGLLNATNVSDYILDASEVMDLNAVPPDNRQMIITPKTRTSILKDVLFVRADQSGSSVALRTGQIGDIYGFSLWSANTQPFIGGGQAAVTAAINNAAGYPAGTATSMVVDTVAGGAFTVGQYVVIAGDDTPLRVTAVPDATHITIGGGLRRDVADNAVIRGVLPGAVDNAAGYAGTTITPRVVGYAKYILTDGWTSAPKTGQPVSFGVAAEIYTIIEVSSKDAAGVALAGGSYNIMLDRPLEASIANNATVNLGPAGNYNFAFNKNAMAAAFRPLPKPRTGALSAVINYKNIALRVTISYNAIAQAHIVTLDLLMGVAVFDPTQAAVMFG